MTAPHHALALRVLHSNSFTNVRGKGSDAALTRKMIPKEGYVIYGRGDFHGPCVALGDPMQAAAIMRRAVRIITIRTSSFLSIRYIHCLSGWEVPWFAGG